MRRKLIRRLVAAAIFTALLALLMSVIHQVPTAEKQYEVSSADVDVELQEDGSLLVHERLTFDFTGSFSGAYREFPLNGDARVVEAVVSEDGKDYEPGGSTVLGSYDLPGRYGVVNEQGVPFRIVWHYRADGGSRTFDLSYRVVNATTAYEDVVDVSWNVWGDQWPFWLSDLEARISAASGARPEAAWLRPRSLGADPELGAEASVSVERVPAGEDVGFRATFPAEAISRYAGTVRQPLDGAESIENEEREIDEEYGFVDRAANFATTVQLPVSIGLAAAMLLLTTILALRARERPTGIPKYLHEPPDDSSPAVAYALATEGGYDQRLVLATLLDLVDRGHYEARTPQSADADGLDLEIRAAESRPAGERLLAHEVSVRDFFDLLLDGGWSTLGAMKELIPRHSTTWKARWDQMNSILGAADDHELEWDLDLRSARRLAALCFSATMLVLTILVFIRTHRIGIPLTFWLGTLAFSFAPPANMLRRLDAVGRERNAGWEAFRRWTEDFPSLDDDPPATLALWRRILVHAVGFGTAERIVKSGRIPAPVGEAAAGAGGWAGYAVASGSFGHDFGSFSSGISSQVQPPSSDSGGGGSGGGGGFSGGGGGGAW